MRACATVAPTSFFCSPSISKEAKRVETGPSWQCCEAGGGLPAMCRCLLALLCAGNFHLEGGVPYHLLAILSGNVFEAYSHP